jgi:hypothetical protein
MLAIASLFLIKCIFDLLTNNCPVIKLQIPLLSGPLTHKMQGLWCLRFPNREYPGAFPIVRQGSFLRRGVVLAEERGEFRRGQSPQTYLAVNDAYPGGLSLAGSRAESMTGPHILVSSPHETGTEQI